MSDMGRILQFPEARKPMVEWRGFYSTAQVSRLARIPISTLYDWRSRGIIAPSVEVISGTGAIDHGYSYADLTIIKIMRALRNDKLDLKSARIALNHLYDRLGPPNRGWADSHVYLVGNEIFADRPADKFGTTAAHEFGQKVETRLFGDLFQKLKDVEEAGEIIVPDEFTKYVEVNPDVMGGQPVIRDTRVPTELLTMLKKQGKSVDEISQLYYPVPREAIESAIKYEEFLSSPITHA